MYLLTKYVYAWKMMNGKVIFVHELERKWVAQIFMPMPVQFSEYELKSDLIGSNTQLLLC